jgi:hypothetical protein
MATFNQYVQLKGGWQSSLTEKWQMIPLLIFGVLSLYVSLAACSTRTLTSHLIDTVPDRGGIYLSPHFPSPREVPRPTLE